jgi:porin
VKRDNYCLLGIFLFFSIAKTSLLAGESAPDSPRHQHPPEKSETKGEVEESTPWWKGDFATGEWNGARKWAEDRGLTFELVYTGESQTNVRGGLNVNGASEYTGAVDVTATLDFEKIAGHKGGTLYFWFEEVHGKGISEHHVGDYQVVSNLEVEPFRTLYEYWYKQEFFDGRFWILGGKFDANVNFASTDVGGNFIQSSFGFPPNVPFGTYPDTGVGFQAGFKINDMAYIQTMIQDGAPNENSISGWRRAFSAERGAIGLFEFHFTPPWLPKHLPGKYKFGTWHHTADFPALSNPARDFSNNYGFYFIADQTVFKEKRDDEEDSQGLSIFAQVSGAPEDRNEVELYMGAGLVYTGLFPTRDEDAFGIGAAHVKFSDRLNRVTGQNYETSFELFYRVQITPFLLAQPSIQFVDQPGGRSSINDATAVGLRFEIRF